MRLQLMVWELYFGIGSANGHASRMKLTGVYNPYGPEINLFIIKMVILSSTPGHRPYWQLKNNHLLSIGKTLNTVGISAKLLSFLLSNGSKFIIVMEIQCF